MAYGAIVDALPTLLEALAEEPALAALVTASPTSAVPRVYGETLPANFTKSATNTAVAAAAIVVASAPGPIEEVPVFHPRFELRAYAGTRAEARDLWFAALAVLHTATIRDVTRGVLVTLSLNSGPTVGVDDLDLPLAYGFFDSTVQGIG